MSAPAPAAALLRGNGLWLLDRAAAALQLNSIEGAVPRLSPEERQRGAAMSDRDLALQWQAGRIALRLLLEARCSPLIRCQTFAVEPGRRPSLAGYDLDFSLADSGPLLLIGIATTGRIGVDLERPRELKMTAQRIDLVVAAGEGLGASIAVPLQSWCRIEAFAKAVGRSLAATLAVLGVQGHGEGSLTPGCARARARQARLDADLEVADLTLPDNLIGAIAGTPPFPEVKPLDSDAIAKLAG